jgi:hypothetical protein
MPRDRDEDRPRRGRREDDRDDYEDDRPPRSRRDEEDEDDRPRPRRRRRREHDSPRDSRVYVHETCGGETEVSGDDFARLASPFSWVTQTYCASCGTFAGLRQFAWTDTDEDIASYRRRLRARAPLSLKLCAWVFGPLLGAALCAAIGFACTSDGVSGAVVGGLVGLVLLPLLLMHVLAKWVWGIDYRRER